jgi:hypothetical protein
MMYHSTPKIAIITLAIGADYVKAMEPGLQSKRDYAKRHGYDLHIGGKEVWDRTRPIPWSKLKYIFEFIDKYDYIFWSDADVLITNPNISLNAAVLPLLPPTKDLLWTKDVVGNLNSGNMLLRGKSAWLKDFIERTYQQTDLVNHIWWENAAMIRLFQTVPTDAAKIETLTDYTIFNSYLFGPKNKANDASVRLFAQTDFLLHFAGVTGQWNIYRMMIYMNHCLKTGTPHNTTMLDIWYEQSLKSKADAVTSLSHLKIDV